MNSNGNLKQTKNLITDVQIRHRFGMANTTKYSFKFPTPNNTFITLNKY